MSNKPIFNYNKLKPSVKKLFDECKKKYDLNEKDIIPTGKQKNHPYIGKDISLACSKKKTTKLNTKDKKTHSKTQKQKSKSLPKSLPKSPVKELIGYNLLRKKFTKKKIYLKGGGLQERRAALSKLFQLNDVGHDTDGQLVRTETQDLLGLDTSWNNEELENFVKRTERIENEDELRQFAKYLDQLDYDGAENIKKVWLSQSVKDFILNPSKLSEQRFEELIEILNKRPWKLVGKIN